MVKKFSFLLLPFFWTVFVYGQRGNVVYLEAGGNGIIGTLNYERTNFKITNNSEGGDGIRIGLGILPSYYQTSDSFKLIKRQNGNAYSLIVGYNYFFNWSLTGVNPNFFEIGLNAVFVTKNSTIDKLWDFKNKFRAFPSLNIGYRHQSTETKNIFWRVNYCPFYISSGLKHWIGASIGYSF